MVIFRFLRWRQSAILDFQKLEILTAFKVWSCNLCHRVKFRADRRIRCQDGHLSIFQDGDLRHLVFLKLQIFNGHQCRIA